MSPPVIDHFKEILGKLHIDLSDPKIVKYQQVWLAKLVEEFIIRPIPPADRKVSQQARCPEAADTHPEHVCGMSKSRQDKGFSCTGRPSHNQVVSFPDPVAGGEGFDISSFNASCRIIIDVRQKGCRVTEAGFLNEVFQPGLMAVVCLCCYNLRKAVVK